MKTKFFTLALLLCSCFAIISCNGDDEQAPDINLNTYIIGTWHSYRMTAYGNGREVSVDITKNNEYSVSYAELTFDTHGNVTQSAWMNNPDGTSKWVSEVGSYTVIGNTVEIQESKSEGNTESGWNNGMEFQTTPGNYGTRASANDEVITLMFNQQNKNLYVRFNQMVNGINVTGNLYFRK